MKLYKELIHILKKASPAFKKRLFSIIFLLFGLNCFVWIATIILWQTYPVMLGLVTLAYGLGLRHAVDADHIAVIDNTTRKLMQERKRPIGVGFFFSLGHSTIVILLSTLIILSTSFVKHSLPQLQHAGGIIGTSVSSFFLLIIGIINCIVLIDIFKTWRKIITGNEKYNDVLVEKKIQKRGITARMLTPLMKTVSQSWHMYFVGFLFGLGFDTASEIGLLSISATTNTSGIPFQASIILPIAFTAGMALIDTFDGIFMLGAYGWAYVKPMRKLYYNMNITFISVITALFIGGIEALQVLLVQMNLHGSFANHILTINFGNLGYIIVTIFLASWLISLGVYKLKKYDQLENH